ncbi:hypothetical protein RyT2_05610 [Pseudolactococcus yaeyamensis]
MVTIARPIAKAVTKEDYLAAAKGIAQHLRQEAVKTEVGTYWQKTEQGEPILDFYVGSSGIALFLIQLAAITGEASYLEEAIAAGNFIVNKLEAGNYSEHLTLGWAFSDVQANSRFAFHGNGYAGIAFSLIELTKATGDASYAHAAHKIIDEIVINAKEVTSGVIWSGYSGIQQDFGTALFLLYAADYFKEEQLKKLAVKAGLAILSTEIPTHEGGARYTGFKNVLDVYHQGNPDNLHFPNYAYGTSGIGHGFATLYQATGDERFLEGAKKAATYLIAISEEVSDGKLIPYLQPKNAENIFYLGFCHGPAGSARLFYDLYTLTNEPQYLTFFDDLIEGIIATGAPEKHSTGYWQIHCQCCGSAGVLQFLTEAYIASKNEKYLTYALRTADAILGEGHIDETQTAKWYQAWTRTKPADIQNHLGYLIGDAGLGGAYAELYGFLAVPDYTAIRLPDDPFPAHR